MAVQLLDVDYIRSVKYPKVSSQIEFACYLAEEWSCFSKQFKVVDMCESIMDELVEKYPNKKSEK